MALASAKLIAGKAWHPAIGSATSAKIVQKVSASDLVVALRREITSERYRRDDRLPSEREIALRFGVARGTVREALKRLARAGLVERRGGSGTYVRYCETTRSEIVVRASTPADFMVAREAIEPKIAELAAQNATALDRYELRQALQDLDDCECERDRFAAGDNRFHSALARCARNSLMETVYRQISRVRHHGNWALARNSVLTPRAILAYNRQHRAIAQAVFRRDGHGAEVAMKRHLHFAQDALRSMFGI